MTNTASTNNTRILIYSYDVFGLGHLRRSLKIAKQLANTIPQATILILTGNNELHTVPTRRPIDFVKLPCFHREAGGQYVPKYLETSVQVLSRMRADVIHATFRSFRPHLVLVDHAPTGVRGELLKSIRWLKRKRSDARLVLCLRDILDDPAAVQRLWKRRRLHNAIEKYYDSIWVFGSPNVYDVVEEYGFPESFARKLNYCGYLMTDPKLRDPDTVRRELRVGAGKFVVVTGGGGGDAFKLMKTYLKSLKTLNGRLNGDSGGALHSLLVLGPEMPLHDRRRLQVKANSAPGVTKVLEFSTEMVNYMNAADLVVSMGGYNSLCEILALQKRAIIVPRVHPVNEQWIRTERLQALGLVDMLHPEELSPDALTEKVLAALQENRDTPFTPVDVLDTGGLPRVCRYVTSALAAGTPL
jgi:predicted glycosyltransferase